MLSSRSRTQSPSQLASENTPLLTEDGQDRVHEAHVETLCGDQNGLDDHGWSKGQNSWNLVVLFGVVLAIQMGMRVIVIPLGRTIEAAVCYEYWKQHDPGEIPSSGEIPEKMCKSADVQASFATVQGYYLLLDSLLSAFFSIPYGLLTERIGWRPVMLLNAAGYATNAILLLVPLYYHHIFPARAIWLSPLAWSIGGGPAFMFSVLWNLAAEAVNESKRAVIFFRLGVMDMTAFFIAGVVSSGLMAINPWIPISIGVCLNAIALITVLSLLKRITPDSMPVSHGKACNISSSSNSSNRSGDDESEAHRYSDITEMPHVDGGPAGEPHSSQPLSSSGSVFEMVRKSLSSYSFLLNPRILIILSSFPILQFYRKEFIVQYLSVRFDWSLARASFIVSFQPALNIPVLLFILPYVAKRLNTYLSPQQTDLYLARFCITCYTIAMICMTSAFSLPLLLASMLFHAAGVGTLLLARSLVTGLVEKNKVTRLFTVIQAIYEVGSVVAAFSVTSLFNVGLGIGGVGIGLPYLVTTVLFAIVGVGFWTLTMPDS